jgi:phage protein D
MAVQPLYVPDFRLAIDGVEIPTGLRNSVTSVRFQEGLGAADRLEVGIGNVNLRWLQQHIKGLGFQPFATSVHSGSTSTASLTPAGLFDIDNKVEMAMGYAPGPLEGLFVGEVTGVEASFPSGGVPTMTLVAHDYLHRLGEGSYARGFGPLPDFIVASILAVEHSLTPSIEPVVMGASTAMAVVNFIFKGAGTKQKNQSNLELLNEIADRYDAEFNVEGDVLYITRFQKEYTPRLTLTWGESLLEFSPKITTVGQSVGVAFKFTLREIPLDFLVKVYYDFDRESVGIVVVPGVAAPTAMTGGPVFTVVDRPIGSPADIASSALVIAHELRTKLNNRLTGTGSCIGDPRIRAGTVIRLEGLGPDFSGDYRVKSVTHSLQASGYTTNFEVRKELIP